MAAKKARAEKTVLSRQEIGNRRRALTEKKLTTGGAGRRAIAGVFLLAGGLLTLLSLVTFDVRDRVGPGFHNAAGPVGHALSDGLLGLLGYCAYVVPLALVYAAVVIFVGARDKRRMPQFLAVALLVVSCAVLAQLAFAHSPHLAHQPGGVLGEALATTLCGLFSVAGTLIVVTALAIAALIVGTQMAFLKLCALFAHFASALWQEAKLAFARFVEDQKKAFERRKVEAAHAKLEEAAFFAQLEADEEELAEAERAAAEADEIAEAAHQLSRQSDPPALAAGPSASARSLPKITTAPKKPEAAPPPRAESKSIAPARAALPLNPTPLPGEDPAWASALFTQPSAPPPQQPAPVVKQKERAVKPEKPEETPSAPAFNAAAISPVKDTHSVPPPTSALAAPSDKPPARTPLIVEPKAPPKPNARAKEEFQFAAGRTHFSPPPLDVLECDKHERSTLDKDAFLQTAEKLRAKLSDFGIVGEVVEIRPGPVVTMYEFLPGPGIKVSKIASLADDLAMAMEALRVRIVAPIPGKGVVGIEVPNKDRETVFLKEIAEQDAFVKSASKLAMCVGKDIEGMPYVFDLAKAPHILMAGTTGSGKSVAVNSMIMSILLKATPEEVRFIMVDPKMLELSVYEGIPHLLLPVVTDPKKAALALRWAVEEMERRYHLLSEAGVRNISGYNKLVESAEGQAKSVLKKEAARPAPKKRVILDVAPDAGVAQTAEPSNQMGVPRPSDEEDAELLPSFEPVLEEAALEEEAPLAAEAQEADAEEGEPKEELKKLPYIVVIIDELADLMMVASREVETYIARLAQMARAAGIHLMVATQRPSTDVVTGIIKANFPTRISFMLRSKPDSMTILGTVGAEALLGMGDMMIQPPTSSHLQRVHGAYVSEGEIKKAVDHLKAQGKPVYDDSILKARDEDAEGGGGQEDELSDELWDQALATVSEMRQVSISMLQRKMRIGYNRAARMIERMERDGVVGPADGAKPRDVLLRPVGEMPGAGAM